MQGSFAQHLFQEIVRTHGRRWFYSLDSSIRKEYESIYRNEDLRITFLLTYKDMYDSFLKERGDLLTSNESKLMQYYSKAKLSIYEVMDVEGSILKLKDLKENSVLDVYTSRTDGILRYNIILGVIFPLESGYVLAPFYYNLLRIYYPHMDISMPIEANVKVLNKIIYDDEFDKFADGFPKEELYISLELTNPKKFSKIVERNENIMYSKEHRAFIIMLDGRWSRKLERIPVHYGERLHVYRTLGIMVITAKGSNYVVSIYTTSLSKAKLILEMFRGTYENAKVLDASRRKVDVHELVDKFVSRENLMDFYKDFPSWDDERKKFYVNLESYFRSIGAKFVDLA